MHALTASTVRATPDTRWCRCRPIRVGVLLTAVVLMSAIDLYLTLLYLMTIGFAEANPLARSIMQTGSPGLLAAWKLLSLVPITLVAWQLRGKRLGEIAAWVACLVMSVVMLHWVQYAGHSQDLTNVMGHIDFRFDDRWVAMEP